MTSIIDDPIWKENYGPELLELMAMFLALNGRDVVLFKCECCDKWSAFHALEKKLLFPVSNSDKEVTIKWLTDNNFSVVGEYINESIQFYN